MAFLVLAGWVGLVVGSFLNVCSDRLPRGGSLLHPPSSCDNCGRRISALDLVPLASYLLLRGRCRYCAAAIPPRVPAVEAATGALFVGLAWLLGPTPQMALAAVYAALYTVIFVIDLEQGLVLNRVVYPALGYALLASLFWPGLGLLKALEGGALALVVFGLLWLVVRGGMGGGDVKLAALVGASAGFPAVLVAILIALVSGGTVAAVLLATRAVGRRSPLPFGPFLATGGFIALLWGEPLFKGYLRLFGA